jgi:hypothetical protein
MKIINILIDIKDYSNLICLLPLLDSNQNYKEFVFFLRTPMIKRKRKIMPMKK